MNVSLDDGSIPSMPARFIAVLIAFGLAGIISSRATMAIPLLLAIPCFALMAERQICWTRTIDSIKSVYGLLVLLIILSWLPGAFASPAPLKSLEAVLRSGLFIGISVLFWSVIIHDKQLYSLLLQAFAGALTVLLGTALIGHFLLPEAYGLITGSGWRAINAKGFLKAAASATTLFIPLLIFMSVLFSGWWRIISSFLIVGCLLLIWVTESRAALAGLMGGLATAGALFLLCRARRATLLPILILILTLLAGTLYGLSKTLPLKDPRPNTNINAEELWLPTSLVDWHRQTIWKYVWHQGTDHRWFGTGANAIDKLPSSKKTIGESNNHYVPLHPHNWLVEVVVETGFVGAAAVILGVLIFIYRRAREFHATGDVAILTMLSLWAIYWTAGLFNFSFWSAWWQICFLVSTGICLAGKGYIFLPRFPHTDRP